MSLKLNSNLTAMERLEKACVRGGRKAGASTLKFQGACKASSPEKAGQHLRSLALTRWSSDGLGNT